MGTTVVTWLFDQTRCAVTTRGISFCITTRVCAGKTSNLCLIPGRSDASTTAVELTQPPFQRAPGYLSRKDKNRGSEPDHLPQSAAEVKNSLTHVTASLIHLHNVVQVENFTASPTPPCQKAIEKLKILSPVSSEFICI